MNWQPVVVCLVIGLAAERAVDAAVLVQYTFTGDAPTSLAPTTTAAGLTASSVNTTGGIGVVSSASGVMIYDDPFAFVGPEAAFAGNSFFQLTATPVAGSSLNLSSLTFDAGCPELAGVFLRSSLDGYSTIIYGHFVGDGTFFPGLTNFQTALSGSVFQNLTTPITIRFYPYRYFPPQISPFVVFDNLTLNGSVESVPEPGTWMIVGLGLAVVGLRQLRG